MVQHTSITLSCHILLTSQVPITIIAMLTAVTFCAALQSSSSQKHMCPLPPPSVMQTWSTMNKLMSRLSVHVLLVLSRGVPLFWTSFTQQPSHSIRAGMSSNLLVQLNGSEQRGSLQLLHSKQSILCPAGIRKLVVEIELRFT